MKYTALSERTIAENKIYHYLWYIKGSRQTLRKKIGREVKEVIVKDIH